MKNNASSRGVGFSPGLSAGHHHPPPPLERPLSHSKMQSRQRKVWRASFVGHTTCILLPTRSFAVDPFRGKGKDLCYHPWLREWHGRNIEFSSMVGTVTHSSGLALHPLSNYGTCCPSTHKHTISSFLGKLI